MALTTPHFAYDEQIASQPRAVAEALERVQVPPLDPDRPLVLSGIGTSLHACCVAAAWLAELSGGRLRPLVQEAHELALHGTLRPNEQVVVVSHRGTKRYPNAVLDKAAEAGATSILVTGQGPTEPRADIVLRTCPQDRASTHSVSYVTALAVLGKLVASLLGDEGAPLATALRQVPGALAATLGRPAPVEVAARLVTKEPLFLTGFGLDALTAREAALKIKEGTYLWAEGMSVEFALHGTPAVFASRMAAITLSPGRDDGGRTGELRAMLRKLEVDTVTCGDEAEDLWFAPVAYLVRPLVAVAPLQRLVAEMARLLGSNPDETRLEAEPWRSAITSVTL